ncbi:short integuments 2, mitochondrial isoform X2 [Cryptomeria japonica]|uniref:short integuments 2, mitochondrial isoform X2 n=1 Tax=Cryptomeria japonica TaxID=3369 RepID=UPI0025AC6463|nr:short integuments 2, mitochondrial isoform X2 [Cryptomeria japonica]
MAKKLGEMAFNRGAINWFPGHMAAATRAIKERLKLADLVLEVRDARIPLSSANADLQSILSQKRRIIVLNKKDLTNSNLIQKWTQHFDQHKHCSHFAHAHNKNNINKEKLKRATVGPLPGVTQDIAGFKIANRPSIYVLDTPGILVPNIPDIDTGLKLSLTGAIKDSIVGEDRVAQYLLAILNTHRIPLHWKDLESKGHEDSAHMFSEGRTGDGSEVSPHQKKKKKNVKSNRMINTEDHTIEVKKALFRTFSGFEGNLENEDDLEHLIESQLIALQKAFRVPPNSGEVGRNKVSKKLVHLYRIGNLGHYILDSIPNGTSRGAIV